MANPQTVNISSAAPSAEAFGSLQIGPISLVGVNTPLPVSAILALGNNTFLVPAGTVGVLITPPAANTFVLLYKTTVGDVGLNIPKGSPSLFIFDQTNLPASIIINAAALVTTGYTNIIFF